MPSPRVLSFADRCKAITKLENRLAAALLLEEGAIYSDEDWREYHTLAMIARGELTEARAGHAKLCLQEAIAASPGRVNMTDLTKRIGAFTLAEAVQSWRRN